MAARTRKNPADATGRRAAVLADENAEAQAVAAQQMSLITAQQEREAQATVVLGEDGAPVGSLDDADEDFADDLDDEYDAEFAATLNPQTQGQVSPEQERYVDPSSVVRELPEERPVAGVQVRQKTQKFRVNTDLENVTIGKDTNFNFYEGRRYEAPTWVFDHLEEKGYIYH